MKLKKRIQIIALFIALPVALIAQQNSAGKCYQIDYDLWNAGTQPSTHINCGNHAALNTGYELTMECWVRIHNAGWNQKIMGKLSGEGKFIGQGYVLGQELAGIYGELWVDGVVHELKSTESYALDSSWVHLALTYTTGDKIRGYVNGLKVAEIEAPSSPLPSTDVPFIIGLAPWDLYSFMSFGQIDEVRVWSTTRTAQQIINTMHRGLKGDEPGLVAWYDFNEASGVNVPDKGPYQSHGTVMDSDNDYWQFAPSFAPVMDLYGSQWLDIQAAWYGKGTDYFFSLASDQGMSLLTDIQPKAYDYVVAGHNGESGQSVENLPALLPDDFTRVAREWYINLGGDVVADVIFNLNNAAAGGDPLPADFDATHYVLLGRSAENTTFQLLGCAQKVLSGAVTFQNIPLGNMIYSLGYATEQVVTPFGLNDAQLLNQQLTVYPMPAGDVINISGVTRADYALYDMQGMLVMKGAIEDDELAVGVCNLVNGIYLLRVTSNGAVASQKVVINHSM